MTTKQGNRIWKAVTIAMVSAGILVTGSACRDSNSSSASGTPITGAKAAASQREALRLSEEEDIPAIAAADRIVIQTAFWAGAKQVTITDQASLKELRSTLTVRETIPSAGEVWASIRWFKGEKEIREIWVYDYGEWGFRRPNTGWTIGNNRDLVAAIKTHLASAIPEVANKPDAGDGK